VFKNPPRNTEVIAKNNKVARLFGSRCTDK